MTRRIIVLVFFYEYAVITNSNETTFSVTVISAVLSKMRGTVHN
jgi:hypothetical protein